MMTDAASRLRTTSELEALGRRHAWDDEFSLDDINRRLHAEAGVEGDDADE